MDCRSFHTLLAAYVQGRLDPNRFDQMVAHEAECEACHRATCEAMDADGADSAGRVGGPGSAGSAGSDLAANSSDTGSVAAGETWLRDTLSKTVGADCSYIELQLAAALDTARPVELPGLIKQHLKSCQHCRAMADTLQDLPAHYAVLPRLRADAGFTREVIERTWGPKAGFREVLRALLARPSLMWEGAVVCALLLTPLAGNTTTRIAQSILTAGSSVQEQVVSSKTPPGVTRQADDLSDRLGSFHRSQTRAIEKEWTVARERIESSLDDLVGERLGENASVALVRSLARHTLGTLGLIEEDPVGDSQASPAEEPSPKADTSEGGSQ